MTANPGPAFERPATGDVTSMDRRFVGDFRCGLEGDLPSEVHQEPERLGLISERCPQYA